MHDDCVMSLAIGLWIVTEHPYQPGMSKEAFPMITDGQLEKSAEIQAEEYDHEEDFETSYA
jgi:hypothetical protein